MMREDVAMHIESILLANGESISMKRLAWAVGVSEEEVRNVVDDLRAEYLERKRGFVIMEKDGFFQLATHPDCAFSVKKAVKGEMSQSLTPAALEVLAIVAYRGPISRSEIEAIRGVNCSFILRNLLIRGLVERMESSEDSRLFLYKTSFAFLRSVGVSAIEQLPEYESLKKDTRIENATHHSLQEN